MAIRKGDRVAVISGKEKGKRGRILRVIPDNQRIVIEGLHLIKRATKPTQKNPQGGFMTREGTIHASNVQIVCPNCDQPTRIGHRMTGEGQRVRVCRRCSGDIDKE